MNGDNCVGVPQYVRDAIHRRRRIGGYIPFGDELIDRVAANDVLAESERFAGRSFYAAVEMIHVVLRRHGIAG